MLNFLKIALSLTLFISCSISAKTISVPMQLLGENGQNVSIGTIALTDTRQGLLITPNLQKLPPGLHGFHVHENPDCGDKGMAAGEHFDPKKTKKHLGPYRDGHLGDLPALYVNQEGKATLPILAPRLTSSDILNRTLIIHSGGDNYSDKPEKNGGGGDKLACGVTAVPEKTGTAS